MNKKPQIFDIELQAMLNYLETKPALQWNLAGALSYFYTLLPLTGQYLTLVEQSDVIVLPELQLLAAQHGHDWLAQTILSEIEQGRKLFEPYQQKFDPYNQSVFNQLTITARTTMHPVNRDSDLTDLPEDRAVALLLGVEIERGAMGGGICFKADESYPFMPKRFLIALANHALRKENDEFDSWKARSHRDYTRRLALYQVRLPDCIQLEGDLSAWQNFLKQCS